MDIQGQAGNDTVKVIMPGDPSAAVYKG